MRRRVRRQRHPPALMLVAGSALVLAATGAAWACVPQPRLIVLPQASGPAGNPITLEGIGFDPAPSRAEVRWNTIGGTLLGTTGQPDFSLTVTIPDVPPDLYAILVLSRDANGAIGNTARASFQVVGDGYVYGSNGAIPAPPATNGSPSPPAVSPGQSDPLLWVGSGVVAGVALLVLGAFIGARLGRARAETVPSPHRPGWP